MTRAAQPKQLSLLPPAPLLAATASAELESLGTALPRTVRLGTSSWAFPGWRGLVYDKGYAASDLAQRGLVPYGRHPLLRTVGIDRSHYAPLATDDLRGFAGQVPSSFRFLMKAHEACTLARYPAHPRYGAHAGRDNPLFFDAAYAAEQVVRPFVEGLAERAGVLLFQLAAQSPQVLGDPARFAARLHAFLRALPRGPLYAVEVRNAALLTPAYAAALADAGAVHCYNAHPAMPPLARQAQLLAGVAWRALVVRWMLRDGLTYEEGVRRYKPFSTLVDPDADTRGAVARLVQRAVAEALPAFVIVNNKAEGSAPLSIVELARQIAAP